MATAVEIKDADGVSELDLDKVTFYETLPAEVWELIFLGLKYEKICELRLVCQSFNQIGKKLLEKGKTKVENKLAQHVKFSKSQLLTFGCRAPNSIKYTLLYLVDKSRNCLCNLFREFIGKNVECFTLGKMIDFLKAFFVVLEDDQLFDSKHFNFLLVLKFWRTTYDKDQMKQMGAFDFCVFMWLTSGEFTLCFCDPAIILCLPQAKKIRHWQDWAECLENNDSRKNISAFYGSYKHAFTPADDDDKLPHDLYGFRAEKIYDFDKDVGGNFGGRALLSNEHWTPYEPPEMNEECFVLFKKYLFQHLKL